MKSKLILPILVVITLCSAIGIVSLMALTSSVLDEQAHHSDKLTEAMFVSNAMEHSAEIDGMIQTIARNAMVEAAIFAQMEEVKAAYRMALAGNIEVEEDPLVQSARQQLRDSLKGIIAGYKQLTGVKDFHLHFHLPSVRSFDRTWRDGWQVNRNGQKLDISDDLSGFRATVVSVNQTGKKPIMGIEVGRGGFVVRGIVPISDDDGSHLGSCEIFYSFNAVMEAAHTTDEFQMAVYMDKELLDIATSINDPQKFPVLENRYVRTATTRDSAFDQVMTAELLNEGRTGVKARFAGNDFIATFPIRDYSGEVVGVFALNYDTTRLLAAREDMNNAVAAAQKQISFSSIAGVFMILLVVGVVIYILIGYITRPLGEIISVLATVSNRDLSHDVSAQLLQRKDEVGDIAGSVNQVIENLRKIIREIGSNTAVLTTSSGDLSSVSTQTVQSVRTLSERTSSVAAAAEETSANTDSVAEGMGQATNSLSSVAGATEEMSATVSEIAGNTEKARRISEQAMQQAQGVTSTMQSLGAAAREIDRVTETITEISSQTNLLALNATIEAARAGEAGKGFAVVAGEIKELARQTAQATEDIKQRISGIQASTGSAVADIDQINQVIREVGELVNSIAAAIEEQSVVTRDLAGNIAQVSAGVQDANERVGQTAGVARKMARDIAEVNTAAADIRSGGEQVQASAAALSNLAEQLKELVGQFKVA